MPGLLIRIRTIKAMPVFTYTATDKSGTITKTSSVALDEANLEKQLGREGRLLVDVLKVQQKSVKAGSSTKIKSKELIEFAYHMSVMTRSGIPLIAGIEDFTSQRASPQLKNVLDDIVKEVNSGRLLSEALERHKKAFGSMFIDMVKAGEASGSLDVVMERLYKEMEWQSGIKAKLKQALVYPAVLLVALTGLVTLLLTFLLPKVMGLFPEGEMELPLPTKILMAASGFLRSYWLPFLVLAVLVPVFIRIARISEKGRYCTDMALMKIPIVGSIVLDISVARFISTLRTLFGSGVEVVKALRISGASTGNSVIKRRSEMICDEVMNGSLLSEAFNKVKEFNSMIQSMMSMCERTGQTTEGLERITGYFDTVIPRRVKKAISIMEPAIIGLAGLLVGFVLVGTLLPMFNLYSAL